MMEGNNMGELKTLITDYNKLLYSFFPDIVYFPDKFAGTIYEELYHEIESEFELNWREKEGSILLEELVKKLDSFMMHNKMYQDLKSIIEHQRFITEKYLLGAQKYSRLGFCFYHIKNSPDFLVDYVEFAIEKNQKESGYDDSNWF